MDTKPSSIASETLAYQPPEDDEPEQAPAADEPKGLRENQIVLATVVRLEGDCALVEFGYTAPGKVPLVELARPEGQEPVKPGDRLEVLVEALPEESGKLVVSKEKADKVRLWDSVAAKCSSGALVQGTVVAQVTGGGSGQAMASPPPEHPPCHH